MFLTANGRVQKKTVGDVAVYKNGSDFMFKQNTTEATLWPGIIQAGHFNIFKYSYFMVWLLHAL